MNGMAINFSNTIAIKLIAKKTNLTLLEAKSQVLNFKANKGISAFNKKELSNVVAIKNHLLKIILSIKGVY